MRCVFQVRSSSPSVLDTTYFGRAFMRLENMSPDRPDHAAANACHVCFRSDALRVPGEVLVAERAGHDVLRKSVHEVGEHVTGPARPRGGERLPRVLPI